MHLWIQYMMTEVCSAGFPHSEIAGSQDICSSPALIAAYHVFHRLSVPRHPPCALCSMTTSLYSVTTMGRSFSLRKKCVCKKLILYGLMSYHFQYVVFKVRVFYKTQIFLKSIRGTRESPILSFTDILQIRPPFPAGNYKQAYIPSGTVVRAFKKIFVEITRFELVTSCLQGRRSPN